MPQWARDLPHRPDPNRVSSLQTVRPGEFAPSHGRENLPADPATATAARRPPQGMARAADPHSKAAEPSYYDVPMLKPPVWTWEVAAYFYLGGMSAGAFLLSRMAHRFGGKSFEGLAKAGSFVALGALLPCPPLLIADLGDPKRFHHMLRVWKPGSPMNLGTWAITAYGGAATAEAIRHYLAERQNTISHSERSRLLKMMNNGVVLAAHDAAGVPLALVVASYTGVLLSCTANPLWCKNPWLAPMFAASAIGTGAEAISLALDCTNTQRAESTAQRALKNVDTLAHAAEGIALGGFLRFAGEKGVPLTHGRAAKYHHLSIGAIVAAEILKRLWLPSFLRKPARMLTAILGLTGGFSLRWGLLAAGREAAENPHINRLVGGNRQPDHR